MDGTPSGFWAKLEQDEAGHVRQWHPLPAHCADVAACVEAILRHTLIGARMARLCGRPSLSEGDIARLAFIAVLHDIGKLVRGFQNRAFGRLPKTGHVSEVLRMFPSDYSIAERIRQTLEFGRLQSWAPDGGALRLLVAAIGHHGRPMGVDGGPQGADLWDSDGRLDPIEGMAELVAAAKAWFPAAVEPQEPLDVPAPMQHAYAGLVMLADWLGSNTAFFPFSQASDVDRMAFARQQAQLALSHIGMDARPARRSLGAEAPGFSSVTDEFAPNGLQRAVLGLDSKSGPSLVILEGETGTGKTEAAFMRYLRLFHAGLVDGIYFALPMRTAATQLYERLRRMRDRAFPDVGAQPPVILAVPGYISADGATGRRLPDFRVLWNDDEDERLRFRGWAAEHPKRYLAGNLVAGTVDQVLLSALQVSHAHMRATALSRLLLVVDEVHASDPYMARLLKHVLDHHLAAGGHAMLMSATLGASAASRLTGDPCPDLAAAVGTPYPQITCRTGTGRATITPIERAHPSKTVELQVCPCAADAQAVALKALEAAGRGARVLVIRNLVRDCRDTQRAAEAIAPHLLLHCGRVPVPHHSRYAREDRGALDRAIEGLFGKGARQCGVAAMATQTVQQSLDLDSDLLITDLCSVDVLIQRLGRLHRHCRRRPEGFEQPRVLVLVPAERDLAPYLRRDGDAYGPHGYGTVYPDLRVLEASWRAVEEHSRWRIPAMSRSLVEAVTHPEALAAIVKELGGPWDEHAARITGRDLADRRVAGVNMIDRSQPFWTGQVEFPSREAQRRIGTRLGENDRLIRLSEPAESPFGLIFRQIAVPAWLARGLPVGELIARAERRAEGLRLTVGGVTFSYDRMGLERLDEDQKVEEELDG